MNDGNGGVAGIPLMIGTLSPIISKIVPTTTVLTLGAAGHQITPIVSFHIIGGTSQAVYHSKSLLSLKVMIDYY